MPDSQADHCIYPRSCQSGDKKIRARFLLSKGNRTKPHGPRTRESLILSPLKRGGAQAADEKNIQNNTAVEELTDKKLLASRIDVK